MTIFENKLSSLMCILQKWVAISTKKFFLGVATCSFIESRFSWDVWCKIFPNKPKNPYWCLLFAYMNLTACKLLQSKVCTNKICTRAEGATRRILFFLWFYWKAEKACWNLLLCFCSVNKAKFVIHSTNLWQVCSMKIFNFWENNLATLYIVIFGRFFISFSLTLCCIVH